jgi:hypothetical protein
MISIITLVLVGSIVVLNFLDNAILRDAQKKVLQKKFDAWWKTVEHYDKLKLALACASKANYLLDATFGDRLFSKRAMFKCVILSTCILVVTLSLLALFTRQSYAVTPWINYNESIKCALEMSDELSSSNTVSILKQFNISTFTPGLNPATNIGIFNYNSNSYLVSITTNGMRTIAKMFPLKHGGVYVSYNRTFELNKPIKSTNILGNVISYNDAVDESSSEVKAFHDEIYKYDKPFYVTVYSVGYFVILFSINSILFFLSLVSCRLMMRELAAVGRSVSTFTVIFTNVVIVFILCGVMLLLFTFLATPLLWIFVPTLYIWSMESLYGIFPLFSSAAFANWVLSGSYLKILVFIAYLPSVFTAIVGLFTLMSIKWRNAFHFILSSILIRCVEKGPVVFLVAAVTFLCSALAGMSYVIHLLDFL